MITALIILGTLSLMAGVFVIGAAVAARRPVPEYDFAPEFQTAGNIISVNSSTMMSAVGE